MALFEITGESLEPILADTFSKLGLLERANIQRAIRAHIQAITPGVRTKVLAEEFGDWAGANRRIDLLCVDENANLVVVELKRDDAAHMDLQALRYAAMISTMRFDQAVAAHRKYLADIGSDDDPEQAIRDFLEIDEGLVAFSDTVRIVLASASFSPELTTAVLWLNKQGKLDIRCVQMRPHAVDSRVLLDIQQVIPLPEAEQYQVAVREKSLEQDKARTSERDTTRYDLTVGETFLPNLPKRRLMLALVSEALREGVSPEKIKQSISWRQRDLFISQPGHADENAFQAMYPGKKLRYFLAPEELFFVDGMTYALSRAWSGRTLEAAEKVKLLLSHPESVMWEPTSAVADEATYEGYVIRRRESNAIEIERDGQQVTPAKPVLRTLAAQLNVPLQNGAGNPLNTQQLGARVISAIHSL
jgi:hypothetical protein